MLQLQKFVCSQNTNKVNECVQYRWTKKIQNLLICDVDWFFKHKLMVIWYLGSLPSKYRHSIQ